MDNETTSKEPTKLPMEDHVGEINNNISDNTRKCGCGGWNAPWRNECGSCGIIL